jgi:hypothetical protein
VVDGDAGETCEPGSDTPCPASCDDGIACTEQMRTGSEDNCNVRCTYMPITQRVGGDGCCLDDDTANDDSDCPPECGNGAVEPGEECDGQADCRADCTRISPNEQTCRELLGDDACDDCQCSACADPLVTCRASGDAAADASCGAVLDCGLANGCSGIDCYCGSASLLACASSPPGPCVPEIQAAAGTADPFVIVGMIGSTDNAVGRALAVGDCAGAACAGECGL